MEQLKPNQNGNQKHNPKNKQRIKKIKLIIIALVSIILMSLIIIASSELYYLHELNKIKPIITVSNNTKNEDFLLHAPEQDIEFTVNYEQTEYDRIISKFKKNHSDKYINNCSISLNGEQKDILVSPAANQIYHFSLNELTTGSHKWNVVCKSILHGEVKSEISGDFERIIPLQAKEIKSIETVNSQMASLMFYHNMSPDLKIYNERGYATKNEFLEHEFAGISLNFGNSEPIHYHKDSFQTKGQVSVKVRSDWKAWNEDGQVIKIETEDKELLVFLPCIVNPTGESLFYIADDGSTYFGKQDHYQYHNEYDMDINLTWDEALQKKHMARDTDSDYPWEELKKIEDEKRQAFLDTVITNEDVDRYLNGREYLINFQDAKEDASSVSVASILINKDDLSVMNPDDRTIEDLSKEEDNEIITKKMTNSYITLKSEPYLNSWVNHKIVPDVQDGYLQIINFGEGYYKNDYIQIYIDKFKYPSAIQTIIDHSYYINGEKIINGNTFCRKTNEGIYMPGTFKYSRQCGFTYDTIYVRAYYSSEKQQDGLILDLLNKIYDKIISQ